MEVSSERNHRQDLNFVEWRSKFDLKIANPHHSVSNMHTHHVQRGLVAESARVMEYSSPGFGLESD